MWRYITKSWRELVGYFMAGLLAVLPLVLTIAIVVWVTSFLRDIFGPRTFLGTLLASVGMRFGFEGVVGYLIGIALVVLSLMGIGVLFKWGAKKFFQDLFDGLIQRLPIVGNLYGSLKQLVSMFDRSDETKLKSMRVVYCYFGNTGGGGSIGPDAFAGSNPHRRAQLPRGDYPHGARSVWGRIDLYTRRACQTYRNECRSFY